MFIHLRVKSDYSLLESALKVDQIVDLCVSHGMPAVAINDHNSLAGILQFSEKALSCGVQPIISCEIEVFIAEEIIFKPLLLVQNQNGYENLLRLVSGAFLGSEHHIPIDKLCSQSEGLICISGDLIGKIASNQDALNAVVMKLKHVFLDRFYLELQRHPLPSKGENLSLQISYDYDLPLVATNNILFSSRDYHQAHDSLLCIKNGDYIISDNRETSNPEFFFKSVSEMCHLFRDVPQAVENTLLISQRCSFILHASPPNLPRYQCDASESDELILQAREGLKLRFSNGEVPSNYKERLNYEAKVICDMDYAGYFLIVSDFVRWGKDQGIPIGPGRGSGVGSVVAWSLRITEIDPIEYGLIFERFLNPERVSMPDFDIDFCQEKRDLVIQYIIKKYKFVAHIITFGKLQPRAVIRDVGRIMQLPYRQVDEICKAIPSNPISPVSLAEAIAMDKDLQSQQKDDESIKQLFDLSLKLEGLYRHASIHAAGIVISSEPISDAIPLFQDKDHSLPITQYSMKYVERAGLVKFDFLGLKTLTVIDKTKKLIGKKNIGFHTGDTQTFDSLSRGDSVGVFQLENNFMQNTLRRLKPDNVEDIIALISLNRPGPMSNIPVYIDRKHGLQKVFYPDDSLAPILEETFGVIIYQEQVMQIAQVLSGYTMSAADLLRRAMGKKIASEMEKQRNAFTKGAVSRGMSSEKANNIFLLVEKFAGYGFNKSHAAAYAMISMETAYLKAHYPVHFLVVLMNMDIHSVDKLGIFFYDAKRHNIPVLPPDINKSDAKFSIEDGAIRFGLAAIRNIGILVAESISSSKYSSLQDFIIKCDSSVINKKVLENLIKSGSLDPLHSNRRQLLFSVEKLILLNSNIRSMPGQGSLFGTDCKESLSDSDEYAFPEKITEQFAATGLYLDGHPLDRYTNLLKNLGHNKILGVLIGIKMRSVKKSRFININLDTSDNIENITFYGDDILESSKDCFVVGNLVMVDCNPSSSGNSGYVGNRIVLLDDLLTNFVNRIECRVKSMEDIEYVRSMLKDKGRIKVKLRTVINQKEVVIDLGDSFSLNLERITQFDRHLPIELFFRF